MSKLTRRELMNLGAMTGAALCLPSCATGPVRVDPNREYFAASPASGAGRRGVIAMVSLLRDAGAGRVIVGDQSGADHVRSWKSGRRSSTRRMFEKNGLLEPIQRSGAELHCFDHHPWEESFQPQLDFDDHLAALQGHRVDPLQVRVAPDRLPDDMLSHLRVAGAAIVPQ